MTFSPSTLPLLVVLLLPTDMVTTKRGLSTFHSIPSFLVCR